MTVRPTLAEGQTLCDVCPDPGRCCRAFRLYGNGPDGDLARDTKEHSFWADEGLAAVLARMDRQGLPFEPIEASVRRRWTVPEDPAWQEHGRREYVSYDFTCPKLTPDGRCSIHAARPSICRDFEAGGEDSLCVFGGANRVAAKTEGQS